MSGDFFVNEGHKKMYCGLVSDAINYTSGRPLRYMRYPTRGPQTVCTQRHSAGRFDAHSGAMSQIRCRSAASWVFPAILYKQYTHIEDAPT